MARCERFSERARVNRCGAEAGHLAYVSLADYPRDPEDMIVRPFTLDTRTLSIGHLCGALAIPCIADILSATRDRQSELAGRLQLG